MPRKTKTLKPFGGYQSAERPTTPPPAVRPAHRAGVIEVNIQMESLNMAYFDKLDKDRKKFAREWLIACGWDGENIEQARHLAEGYAIVDLPTEGFTIQRVRDIVDSALKETENTLEEI